MDKKTNILQKIALLIIPIVLCVSSLNGLLSSPHKVSAATAFDLSLEVKYELQKFCNGLIGAVVLSRNTPNLEGVIDQSGVLTSPCGTGYAGGFFGDKSKSAICDPNFVNNPDQPLLPTAPITPGEPPAPSPTSAQDKARCRKGYDAGINQQGSVIKQTSSEAENICNNTASSKKEQCKKDLESCNKKPNNKKLACFQKLKKDYPTDPASVDAAGDSQKSCEDEGGVLGWIICPLIDLATSFSDFAFQQIIAPMLEKIPISADRHDPGYKSWQGFRFLANIMLIGTLLAIVYSQARGGKE